MDRNRIVDYILLSRPYTIPGIALVAILANVFVRGNLVLDYSTVIDIIFALVIWLLVVYLSESFHKHAERPKAPIAVPAAFFVIALIISIIVNYFTVLFLVLALIAAIVYSSKSIGWFGSSFVFIFRGGIELAIFLSIILFHSANITNEALVVGIMLLLITDSRNLIGDIRDVLSDKYTFPKKYGNTISYVVSFIFTLIVIVLTPSLYISIPLIAILLLLILSRSAYLLHHLFVVTTVFYLLNYISYLLSFDLF